MLYIKYRSQAAKTVMHETHISDSLLYDEQTGMRNKRHRCAKHEGRTVAPGQGEVGEVRRVVWLVLRAVMA